MKKICLLCIFFICSSSYGYLQDQEGRRYLMLTSGRCGTHLMMYCLSYLTKRQIESNRFKLPVDPKKAWIDQKHIFSKDRYNPERDYLICMIRNYKEVCLKDACENIDEVKFAFKHGYFRTLQSGRKKPYLFDVLNVYHNWHLDRKILIFYEDFINNPKEVLRSILNFLNEPLDDLNNFIASFEYHKNIPLIFYETQGTSSSQGKDFFWHSKFHSKEDLQELDQLVKKRYPRLYELYLKRYEE